MATCCNPVTAPTCTPTPCPQLYNACCVINEANLPCLYPPVDASGVSTAYSYNITNVEVFGGNAIEDIVTGMTAFTVVDSVETAIGKVTVDSLLTTVTLDTAPATYSGNLVFKFVEQTQCDINEAVDAAICALKAGTVPCPSFTPVVFSEGDSLVWTNFGSSRQVAEYSDVQNCTIRLRGVIKTTVSSGAAAVNSLVTTLPTVPASVRSFSVTVRLVDGTASTQFYPGFVTIAPDGTVYLDFINNIAGAFPWEVSFSFDSIFFEVSPL